MSNTNLNQFISYGTAAQRAAFTPSPPTPASGPSPGYVWIETDTHQMYGYNGSAYLWLGSQLKGGNITSASTISIPDGSYFHVTGTTTITDIDFATDQSGRAAILCFDGILTLTYNATTLKLPTSANITTAAGDTCLVVSEDGADNVKVVWYQRADGTPLSGGGGGGTVTTTGSPASGNLTKFSGATSVTSGDLSGDISTSGTLVTTIGSAKVTPTKLSPSDVNVTLAADQTAANYTSFTAIPFDSEAFDDGSWHDNSTNNTRLTVPSGVTRVIVSANITVTDTTGETVSYAEIRKNGSATFIAGQNHRCGTTQTDRLLSLTTGVIGVTAGDYFELFYLETVDNSITIVKTSTNFSAFAVG